VFAGEALDTFQLDHEHVFDEDIGKVFSNVVALVSSVSRSLRVGRSTRPIRAG
jgi:hypothetical protein